MDVDEPWAQANADADVEAPTTLNASPAIPAPSIADEPPSASADADLKIPSGTSSSTSPATTPTHTSEARPKHTVSAEPPKWRFVADAKKTSGYSTLAAGQYIQGKTSEELGAKYVAPDISLYKDKGDKPEVGKLQIKSPESAACNKQDVEVGKLKISQVGATTSESSIRELQSKPEDVDQPNDVQSSTKEMQTDTEEERVSTDDPNQDEATPSVECIESNENDPSKEMKSIPVHAGEHVPMLGGTDVIISEASSDIDADADPGKGGDDQDGHPNRKRNRFLYLVILLLLMLVIILGVLLGKKNNSEDESIAASEEAGATPELKGQTIVVNTSMPSAVPSAVPTIVRSEEPSSATSIAPSSICNSAATVFSMEHPNESSSSENSFASSFANPSNNKKYATWILKNACSGEVISKCQPCSLGTVSFGSSTLTKPQTSKEPFTRGRRIQQNSLQNFTQCLPINQAYVFEVQPLDFPELCCGFDHTAFSISYDNTMVANGTTLENGLFSSEVFFGQSTATCIRGAASQPDTTKPSFEPSQAQEETAGPTSNPTIAPVTFQPTLNPSTQPITAAPSRFPTSSPMKSLTLSPINRATESPLAFLGQCPEAYGYLSSYTLGARVESNGVVYQCSSVTCRSYGLEPGRNWVALGLCFNPTPSPTSIPSMSPLQQPTPSPSRRPTVQPTSSPSKKPSPFPSYQPSSAPTAGPTGTTALPTASPTTHQPTFSPSRVPTVKPSRSPSKKPSTTPSTSPSSKPSKAPSRQPTLKPTLFPSVQPSASPSKSPSGKPSASPSRQPTPKPTLQPSLQPSASPSKSPSNEPTNSPSRKPSRPPSMPPTMFPSSRPTCSADQGRAMDVCVAVDMSGSICNGDTGSLCEECLMGDMVCRESWVAWNSCCGNFVSVKDFSKTLVNAFANLSQDNSFSLVKFASDGDVVSGLTSASQILYRIDSIQYTGGYGNHAVALKLCQQTLSSSPTQKRVILMITDGKTGLPKDVPLDAADLEATSIKNSGTFIVPVVIPDFQPLLDTTYDESISFFTEVSNYGGVFPLPDYQTSSISKVQEELLAYVQCL